VQDEDGCPDTELSFQNGWDECFDNGCSTNVDETLDLANSYVSYSKVPINNLDVTFHFEGADPNRSYQVGLHNFPVDMASCVDDIGQFSSLGCGGSVTRQGVTVDAIEAFEFGNLVTDGSGEGEITFWILNIDSDTYDVQFHVRTGTCPGGGCSVIFESSGIFGTTEAITIP